MAEAVSFLFWPGLRQDLFSNVTLQGWWDAAGRPADQPLSIPMASTRDDTGCLVYQVEAALDSGSLGQDFRWSVTADGPDATNRTMVLAGNGKGKTLDFKLGAGGETQVFYLTLGMHLGANIVKSQDGTQRRDPVFATRFSVFAPNAGTVELILADPASGYVADDGSGTLAALPMVRGAAGIWSVVTDAPDGTPYMYRVTRDDGSIVYRTDLFSRAQIGSGGFDPKGQRFSGQPDQIDGSKSCSLVRDPDLVRDRRGAPIAADTFWAGEFQPGKPLPKSVQDLVIYELHVGALGFGRASAGTLDDAIAFIPHLVELGINAVELLPISEFQSDAGWGYSTSHFAAIEASAGGADRLKHFVRACHREGIAVILDVVYNHYSGDAERAEWMYDTTAHEKNFYYWYEGKPSDWTNASTGQPFPEGGYIDNQSTGYAPGYGNEIVRQLFISSAVAFVTDFHIDGFRVDQTTSIHSYAAFHADGKSADRAKAGGIAFLRQWTQTLRLIKPGIFLMAEDHSGWDHVTMAYDAGGLGFDAAWYSDFYHHLVDFGEGGEEWAKLLRNSGYGDGRWLKMSYFAGALRASAGNKVVYNDSHDEAGNSKGSARTICLAVNNAPLTGATRVWAEARSKVAAGLALLSAGTPMFFMGEEVGAKEPYRYDDFRSHREDIVGLKQGTGAALFRFYKDLIALSRGSAAIRSRNIDILVADDANRLVAFRRFAGDEEILVVASLNDSAFADGYRIDHPSLAGKKWKPVLASDAAIYGGAGIGGTQGPVTAAEGFDPIVPAASLIVFRRDG